MVQVCKLINTVSANPLNNAPLRKVNLKVCRWCCHQEVRVKHHVSVYGWQVGLSFLCLPLALLLLTPTSYLTIRKMGSVTFALVTHALCLIVMCLMTQLTRLCLSEQLKMLSSLKQIQLYSTNATIQPFSSTLLYCSTHVVY